MTPAPELCDPHRFGARRDAPGGGRPRRSRSPGRASPPRTDAVDDRHPRVPHPHARGRDASGRCRARHAAPDDRERPPPRGGRHPARAEGRTSPRRASARPAAPGSSRATCPRTTATCLAAALGPRLGAARARRTATSSRWGSSNENSAYGPVHNPYDLERVPGGSSGGIGGGRGLGRGGLGAASDTGGSVRQPAALCGVVGLKPRTGGSPLRADRVRVVARHRGHAHGSVRDAATPARRDGRGGSPRRHEPGRAGGRLPRPSGWRCGGLRVGIVGEAFGEGVEPALRDAVRASIDRLAALGAEVGEASLPHADYALSRLLSDRAERGLLEPGPLRRRPVRAAAPRAPTPSR